MSEKKSTIKSFRNYLHDNGFSCHENIKQETDCKHLYRSLLRDTLNNFTDVYLFDDKKVIDFMCKEEQYRYREKTGETREICTAKVDAVFIWNQIFNVLRGEYDDTKSWSRLFKINKDDPCVVCLDRIDIPHVICGTCYNKICVMCRKELRSNQCPVCTFRLS